MNYWTQSRDNIFVAAHRGFRSKYPENTMEAFRQALALGVDQIETDIRVTKDGELILLHDATVDRTSNGTGLAIDYTLSELRTLDFGGYMGDEFRNTPIPTLRELFELVKDHPTITLDLELKEYPTQGREALAFDVCDRIVKMAEEYRFGDRIVLNTFSAPLHEYIRDKYGCRYRQHVFFPITCMPGAKRDPYKYAYCCCMFSAFYGRMALPSECDHMAALGVQPWGGASIRDAEGVDEAIRCGMTLITCDNPDVILALLRERGKHA